jgi:serine/threonine protein kinase
MPALFRIVQDDCPPIPDGASSIVKDFLYHCFQKDANLRVSAKKLLRHPWMASTRKHLLAEQPEKEQGETGARPLSNYNFDEAVLKVQEWNEALKCSLISLPLYHVLIVAFQHPLALQNILPERLPNHRGKYLLLGEGNPAFPQRPTTS